MKRPGSATTRVVRGRCASARRIGWQNSLDRQRIAAVCHGKSAADIEAVETLEAARGSVRHQVAAGSDRLDVLAGVGHLRPDMEGQAADGQAEIDRHVEQRRHGRGLASELARQVDHRRRVAERHAQQQLDPLAIPGELAELVGVVDDEPADPVTQRGSDIRRGS